MRLATSALALVFGVCLAVPTIGAADAEKTQLWQPSAKLPTSEEARSVENVRFEVIKRHTPSRDGYRWLHGVALAWHEGRLFATFGLNTGGENTATEIAAGRVSSDGGRSWGELFIIDDGDENLAVSHGVLLSHEGKLWAFQGAFYDRRRRLHTRAYVLQEDTGQWQARGVVARQGFWPVAGPYRMEKGNFIMTGIRVGGRYGGPENPPAVAINDGENLTDWDIEVIPKPEDMRVWGEAALIPHGQHIACISRCRGEKPVAMVSRSEDYGRTWSKLHEGNLPMTASKPWAGTLTTGQRYLICTTTADCGNARHPLTIALTPPDKKQFNRVLKIRSAVHDGPGESHPQARLSYPYAVQHEDKLYVGYSNDGGRGGNHNSAELAVIPLKELQKRR